jgi:PAS domain S-box-containing protein
VRIAIPFVSEMELRLEKKSLLQVAVFFGAYVTVAVLSGALGPGNTCLFWPPAGIYVASLLLVPKRRWPVFVATATLAELLVDFSYYRFSLNVSLGLALANAVDAVSAAYLFRRYCGESLRFSTLHRHPLAMLLAFAVGPAVGAWVGAAVMTVATGGSFVSHWLSWWTGDALGMLVFAPVAVLMAQGRFIWSQWAANPRYAETSLLCAASVIVFCITLRGSQDLEFLSLLPLLWGALRFGLGGAVLTLCAMSIVASRYTAMGVGAFASTYGDLVTRELTTELFIGVVGVTTFVVAALLRQRQDSEKALLDAQTSARIELEQRVVERTAALAASERRYRSLIEAANQAVWTVDADANLRSIRNATSGEAEEKLLGRQWLHRLHPDDVEELLKSWEEFKTSASVGALFEQEHRVRGPQGDWRNVFIRAAPVVEDDGSVREWIGTTIDITERKRAEDALRTSERRYRSLAQASYQTVWTVDTLGHMRYVKQATSGESLEQMEGGGWLKHVHPEDLTGLVQAWEAFQVYGSPTGLFEHECRMRGAGDAWRSVVLRAAAVEDSAGSVREWIGTTTDITKRKLAEQALRASEQRYRTLVEASSDGVWTMDAHANMLSISRSITGASLGRAWLEGLHPDDTAEALRNLTATHPPVAYEQRCRLRVGEEWRLVSVRAAPVFDESGALREWIGTTTDINDRVRAEEALRVSEERYRTLVTASGRSVWTVDAQGGLVALSGSVLGHNLGTSAGKRWLDWVYPEDRQAVWQRVTEALRDPVPYRSQHREFAADGSLHVVCVDVVPLFDKNGSLRELFGTTEDVTARIQAEAALRLSEERFRTLVTASQQSVWVLDAEGNMSALTNSVFGYTGEQTSGKQWLEIIHPDDRTELWTRFQVLVRNPAPDRAEHRMHAADGSLRRVVSQVVPLLNPDGSLRELFGTTLDITEAKRIEEALHLSEERYRTLATAPGRGIWALDPEGNLIETNQAMRELGLADGAGKRWLEWIHPDDRASVWARCQANLRNPAPDKMEHRIIAADGTPRDVAVDVVPLFNADGSLRELFGTTVDITKRKQAEAALKLSEERYRTLVTASKQSVWVLDPEGNMVSMTNSVMDHSLADGAGKRWLEWLHPDDRQAVWEQCSAALRKPAAYAGEQRVLGPDGSIRTIFVHGVPVLNPDGSLREMIGTTTDITARKQAAEALELSEERYRALVTTSRQGVWVIDAEGNMTSLTSSVLGRSLEDSGGKRWLQHIHPEDREMVWERTIDALRSGVPFHGEQRALTADGRYRWLLVHAVPLRGPDGCVRELFGTSTDITERKQAEEALRLSEERYRTLVTASHQSVWRLDPEGNMIALHNSVLGRHIEGNSGKQWLDLVHPDDRAAVWSRVEKVLHTGSLCDSEHRTLMPDGSVRIVLAHAVPVLNGDGSLREVIGTTADLTDRRRAEAALKLSEERFRTLVTASQQSIWVLDMEGNMIALSNSIVGRRLEESSGKQWLQHTHCADRAALWESITGAIRTGVAYSGETRVHAKDGGLRWVFMHAVPVRNADGSVREIIGTTTDITERKRAEEALRLSEERYRTLVTASQQSIWVLDVEGNMIALSNSTIGRNLAESSGKQWLQYVHPEDRERVWERTMRGVRTGVPYDGEQRMLAKDGSYRWGFVHAVPLRNADGAVREMIGTTTDITERKLAEGALHETAESLRRLAARQEELLEAERVRIAHDLHDGVGQLLNVLKLKVVANANRSSSLAQVEEVSQIIDQTSSAIRTLEFELSPPVLRELGLVPALFWLADEMQRQYNLQVSVIDDGKPKPLDQLARAAVFRSVRELLINVARHAGTNHAGVVVRRNEHDLELTIRDAGAGFKTSAPGGKRGLGLVGVRERVTAIGGRCEFMSAAGEGTTVVLRVPLAVPAESSQEVA